MNSASSSGDGPDVTVELVMPVAAGSVRVSRSGFDFTCPGCGIQIGADDFVCTLPVSQLVKWPVCWDCGVFWVENRRVFPQ